MESSHGNEDQSPLISAALGGSSYEVKYLLDGRTADAFIGWQTNELSLDNGDIFIADTEPGTKDNDPQRTFATGVVVSQEGDSEQEASVFLCPGRVNIVRRLLRRHVACEYLLYLTMSIPAQDHK